MDDVLHEQKQEPVKGAFNRPAEHSHEPDKLHGSESESGANQDDDARTFEGVNKSAGEAGRKAFGSGPLKPKGNTFNATTAAGLDDCAARVAGSDAQVAKGAVAFRAK